MTRFLLDTGIAGDVIQRRGPAIERFRAALARGHRVGIAMPVLGELWAGVELSASRDINRDRLRHALASFVIWPFDAPAAEEYGRIFAELRTIGRPMQQVDIQIAAIARSLGRCIVVSKDGDLAAVPRLDVEDWSTPGPASGSKSTG